MPEITLQAGEVRPIATGGLFLSIVEASAKFIVKGSGLGGELTGEIGRQFKVPGITQVEFENRNDSPVTIDYESSNIEVSSGSKGVVSVGNEITVKRIVEAIQVNANATVDNGKMADLPANAYVPLPDLNIPAGQVRKFADARVATNRVVTIQTVTTGNTDLSKLRIGVNNLVDGAGGIVMLGDIDAIAGYEFATETEVWIYNDSAEAADVAGGEKWRA
jgi:hypothetical protein